MYQQILAQADGTEAEEAARANPDVYVALFLAEAQEAIGISDGKIPEGVAPVDSDDPQRDRIFDGMVSQLGGVDGTVEVIREHARASGSSMDADEAFRMLDEWRLHGIPYNISLGEYLNGVRVTRPGGV